MNINTLLLRQVHPSFVLKDNISVQVFTASSQTFRPTPKDDLKLSVYNNEKFSPQESYNHFISQEGNFSFEVLAVNSLECQKESLTCLEDNNPFDGHSIIDFSGKSKGQIEKSAKYLRSAAMSRGWLYI